MDLDSVLNEPEEKSDTTQEQPAVEVNVSSKSKFRAQEKAAQDAGSAPKDAPKKEEIKPEVAPPTPPEQELTAKEKAAFAKAADEARKRQGIEHELALSRQRIAQLEQSQKPVEPPKPFYEDPDGAFKTFETQMAQARAEMANTVVATKVQTAEMIARSQHPDYEEKIQLFSDLVKEVPGLWQQAITSQNPAEFAYKTAKNHKDLQDAGNIDSLRARIEKETRIKLEEEFKQKQEAAIKERASIPSTLSDARGTSQNKVVWNGPTGLDDILHN